MCAELDIIMVFVFELSELEQSPGLTSIFKQNEYVYGRFLARNGARVYFINVGVRHFVIIRCAGDMSKTNDKMNDLRVGTILLPSNFLYTALTIIRLTSFKRCIT